MDADQHLVDLWAGFFNLLNLEDIRGTICITDDRFHFAISLFLVGPAGVGPATKRIQAQFQLGEILLPKTGNYRLNGLAQAQLRGRR